MNRESALKALTKIGQAPGYFPTNVSSNPNANAWENLANIHVNRGIARGVKNIVPGIVDFVVGMPAGILNGLGHGLANAVTGHGNFKDGFSEGYGQSADFTKKYMSDPIRNAEMYYGGNAVKDMFNGAQQHWVGELKKDSPDTDYYGAATPDYVARQRALAQMAGIENGVATLTEYGLPVVTGVGAFGTASKIPAATKAVSGFARATAFVPKVAKGIATGSAIATPPLAAAHSYRTTETDKLEELVGDIREKDQDSLRNQAGELFSILANRTYDELERYNQMPRDEQLKQLREWQEFDARQQERNRQ